MDTPFVTSLTTDSLALPNLGAWEGWEERGRALRKALQNEGRRDEALSLAGYGSVYDIEWRRPPRRLSYEDLTEMPEHKGLGISALLTHEGGFDLPPIFACCLTLLVGSSIIALCESLPFSSIEEARSYFKACLDTELVRVVSGTQGGSAAALAFALCVLPASAEKLVSEPNPTRADVAKLTDELVGAISTLAEVIERWEGTDAFRYLVGRRGRGSRSLLFSPRVTADLRRIPNELVHAKDSLGEAAKGPGRPPTGGKNHLVALLLRVLWQRCGMKGEVSTSPGSRFMKACNLVLPMYGIHKADYSQFMLAELSKRRTKGVVIGR
jgi:hypothetical protein